MPQCEYLDTDATSQLTGISKSALEKWRVYGGGIPFTRAGRLVKYAIKDVHSWMAARRVLSTSESMIEPPKSRPDPKRTVGGTDLHCRHHSSIREGGEQL